MKKNTPIQISYNNLLIIIINSKRKIKFITEPFATLLGYDVGELIDIDIDGFFKKRDINTLKSIIDSIDGAPSVEFHDFKSLIITKTNNSIDLDLQIIQLRNHFLNNFSYVILSNNIIYRKFVKQIFEKSNHDLQKIYSLSNELIIVLNSTRNIIYANNKWEENFGIKAIDNKEIPLADLFDAEVVSTFRESLDQLSKTNSYTNISLRIKSKINTKNYYLEGYILSEQVEGQPFIYQCIFNDISEKIRSEKIKSLYFNISNQIIEHTDLQLVYKNIHNELKEVITCENLYIALHSDDDHTNEIHFPYFLDKNSVLSGFFRPFSKGVTEYAIKQSRPLILTRADLLKLEKNKEIEIVGELPEHWLGVPLHTPTKIIGIIAIQSYYHGYNYTKADLKILDFASSQIAMAIEMAQTRDELQNQTAQLNAIFDSSSHLIWSVNKELEVTSFNKNYVEANFVNHDIDPLNNETSNDLNSKSFWEEKYKRAFNGEKLQFEINLKDEQDHVIWKEIHLNPIYTGSNKISEVSGIAQDITQKKYSELALLQSEEKFRNIFESFQDLYFRCNLYGSLLMVSPSIYDLMGYQTIEVLGKHIDDYYLYNPRAKKILGELKAKKNLKNVEISIVKKNGEVRQCICNIRMVQNNKNEPYEIEGVVRDITQLKITNQQLINANDIAENSLRVKEQFLANMSHEIRTPMNGIIGMIDLLDEPELNASQKKYIETLKKSSAILMDILNDILDLAKIEAGRMELKKSTFSLPYIVDKVHALFTPVASTNKVNLHYHINKALPSYIKTDETKLIQVISNLVSNSLKFTEKGGSIDIGFELIEEINKEAIIRVDVRDSGIGISKENQKLLFKSFEQLDTSTTKSYAGTGLGLAISKQLVTLLGGQIGVFSNPGLGSTFWFTFKASFPKQPIKQDQTQKKISKNRLSQAPLLNKKVLVVDDNSINREVASEILKKAGCQVQLAVSGEESIEQVKAHSFDVVLMDIQMPGMDGIKASQEIRNLNLAVTPKIIAMTAYAMKEDRERFLKMGMDDYLAKPIRAITLIEKVLNQSISNQEALNSIEKEALIPILNLKVVAQLKKYGGAEILDSVYNEFEVETANQLADCKIALEKKDWVALKKILHTLKGTSGTLGIDKVAQKAEELEACLKDDNIYEFEINFYQLIDNFKEFRSNFKKIIKNTD